MAHRPIGEFLLDAALVETDEDDNGEKKGNDEENGANNFDDGEAIGRRRKGG